MLPRKRISHYGFGFLILSVSSSISSILFYQNRPNLSKVSLVCARLHFARLSFPFSGQQPYLLITEHQPVDYKLYFLSEERLFSLTLNGIGGGGGGGEWNSPPRRFFLHCAKTFRTRELKLFDF